MKYLTRLKIMSLTLLLVFTIGCASNNARTAKPIKGTEHLDLKKYTIVTLSPFSDSAVNKVKYGEVGEKFSRNIKSQLEQNFKQYFQKIRFGTPLGSKNELIIKGKIISYKPGSKVARAILIGLGAASFKAELVLAQGDNNHIIATAPIKKLWAWGGMAGAGKGIHEMVNEAAAAAANTIARARGWSPTKKKSSTER